MKNYLEELFTGQQYDKNNFFLLAGPCVVESEELVMEVADKVSSICKNLGIPYILNHLTEKQTEQAGHPLPELVTRQLYAC